MIMKKATCKDLLGACDFVVMGETPEEMAENCKSHAMEMMQKGDSAHIEAGKAMMAMSKEEQMQWYQGFVAGFGELEDA